MDLVNSLGRAIVVGPRGGYSVRRPDGSLMSIPKSKGAPRSDTWPPVRAPRRPRAPPGGSGAAPPTGPSAPTTATNVTNLAAAAENARRRLAAFKVIKGRTGQYWIRTTITTGLSRGQFWAVSERTKSRVVALNTAFSDMAKSPSDDVRGAVEQIWERYQAAKREVKLRTRAAMPPKNRVANVIANRWKTKVGRRLNPPTMTIGEDYKAIEVRVPRVRFDVTTFTKRFFSLRKPVLVHVLDTADTNVGERTRAGALVAPRRSNVDPTWFEDQATYVASLSNDDLMNVMCYTLRSMRWIGPFQRTGKLPQLSEFRWLVQPPHITPLYPQLRNIVDRGRKVFKTETRATRDFGNALLPAPERYKSYREAVTTVDLEPTALREALETYVEDLQRIIRAAPPVRTPIVVYRGTSVDPYKDFVGRSYVSKAFSSTAFTTTHAMMYEQGRGVLQRLTLEPGARALMVASINQWADHGEYEVVLNTGDKYEFVGRNVKRWVFDGQMPRYFRQAVVTDVRVS